MILHKAILKTPFEHFLKFSSQGKGINRRARIYSSDWQYHYDRSQRIIEDWLNRHSSASSINILGAGPLNDVPLESIKNFSKEKTAGSIIITDANIDFYPVWEDKLGDISFQPIVQDVSLKLADWLNYLTSTKFTSYELFLEALENIIDRRTTTAPIFYKANLNISLNLLSQIPIHWQEAVFLISRKRFGNRMTERKKDDLLKALNKSSSMLIESHLNHLIPTTKNPSNLIVFDYKYYFPEKNLLEIELDKSTLSILPTPKFHFKNEGENLIVEQDALFTFDLVKWICKLPATINFKILDSWIWKVVPDSSKMEKTESHFVTCIELSKSKKL